MLRMKAVVRISSEVRGKWLREECGDRGLVQGFSVPLAAVQEVKTLTGSFKDNADILKAIKKQFDGQVVYAAVVNVEEKETLYGITESEFMKYAKELPPRKVYEQ